VIAYGRTCRRRMLDRFDVPQPICKIDRVVELGGLSGDRAASKGGMRTDGETSQSKD
jgi:hypothetical protein